MLATQIEAGHNADRVRETLVRPNMVSKVCVSTVLSCETSDESSSRKLTICCVWNAIELSAHIITVDAGFAPNPFSCYCTCAFRNFVNSRDCVRSPGYRSKLRGVIKKRKNNAPSNNER